MKKTINVGLLAFCMLLGSASVLIAGETESGKAVQHSGQASSQASQAAVHGAAASGQVVSGAAAVPLAASGAAGLASGAAGAASTAAAGALSEGAGMVSGQPLPVAEEAITAGPPPDQALKQDEQHKPAKQ
ncbi:MAG: hypothetical protein AB1545_11130 [Thermodesulfobacteriota bacterium]